jgi:hypothetical protein
MAVEIYGVENLCGSTGIRGEEKTNKWRFIVLK